VLAAPAVRATVTEALRVRKTADHDLILPPLAASMKVPTPEPKTHCETVKSPCGETSVRRKLATVSSCRFKSGRLRLG